jgi:alpha-galactosidase
VAAFAIIVGLPMSANAQLARTPTPYMGWNTYYGVGGNFNEATIVQPHDFVAGFRQAA